MAARKPAQYVVDAAIAVLVLAISLGLLSAGGATGGDVSAAGILLTACAALPLVARRRAPLAVFALTGVAGAALRLAAGPVGPPLGAAVALYTIAAGESGRSRFVAPAVAHDTSATGEARRSRFVAPVAAHDTVATSEPPRSRLVAPVVALVAVLYAVAAAMEAEPQREIALAVLVWGGAWLAGEGTRLRVERIAELEERARRAERDAERERLLAAAEERMRLARDLHDSAGHAISVILVHAGDGRLRAERDPAGARAAFETIEEVARETIGDIDQLVRVLRENGDGVAPPPGVAALDGLVGRHRDAGLEVTATVSGTRRPLPLAVDQGAYRILQEALTNAARHGGGSADVHVEFADGLLELAVTNPLGRARSAGHGHGLVGMRERAAMLGGGLRADTVDGRFEVRAWLPTAK